MSDSIASADSRPRTVIAAIAGPARSFSRPRSVSGVGGMLSHFDAIEVPRISTDSIESEIPAWRHTERPPMVRASDVAFDGEPGTRAAATLRFDSFASWKDFAQDEFPWLEFRSGAASSFEAEVVMHRLGKSLFSTLRTGACEAICSRQLPQLSEAGQVKLIWQLSGHLDAEQGGRSFRLEAGAVGVFDTARPYRLRVSNHASFAILLVPYSAFPGWQEASPHACGRRMADGIAPRAAIAALMSLNGLSTEAVRADGALVMTAMKWMLLGPVLGGGPQQGGDGVGNTLMAKARRHIVEHLGDPALDPDQVASALCMSRRSLYLLFKEHRLTPSRMICDIRLNQAKQSLEDPGQSHQKMTNIALDVGFPDYATFSRLFKATFGITPSEFRSRRRLPLCA